MATNYTETVPPETSHKEMMNDPEIATKIDTGCKYLSSVSCVSEKEFCASERAGGIKCFNAQGTVISTIQTKSGEWSRDIAVTNDWEVVYTDSSARTVNKVKHGQTSISVSPPLLISCCPCSVKMTINPKLPVTPVPQRNKQSSMMMVNLYIQEILTLNTSVRKET
jgi:hypothetical protein